MLQLSALTDSDTRFVELSEIIAKHTFVGVVDAPRCLSLVQHGTRLYLLNHGALAAELFYQLGLRQFGNFSRIRLDPPPDLRTLVALAVDAEAGVAENGLNAEDVVDVSDLALVPDVRKFDLVMQRIVEMLMARREMLQEYFNLSISEKGLIETLPMLLRDYTPNLDKLPLFLMRLGPQVRPAFVSYNPTGVLKGRNTRTQVDWTAEQACFDTFLRELAFLYVPEPLLDLPLDEDSDDQAKDTHKATLWQIQHVLFPAMARYLVPPKTLLDRDVVQVADLPELYRVFERC